MSHFPFSRRDLLAGGAAFGLSVGLAGAAFAAPNTGARKLLVVILRGALDGLAAVAPVSDPNYERLRGRLALTQGEGEPALALREGFVLHPALSYLHGAWGRGQLSIAHAIASPYRERSHFDAQDLLESGASKVYELENGWLNRAIGHLPGTMPASAREGIAVGSTLPIILRGPAKASSWSPPTREGVAQDTLARLDSLYAYDPLFQNGLARALETQAMVGEVERGGRGGGGNFNTAPAFQAAARLIGTPDGPAAAVVSVEGWDTHANQGARQGGLANRLRGLDQGLAAFEAAMGPLWSSTLVLVVTEFGRTVAINGTGGTDHGTGTVSFVLGGAVRGGQFLGDWPGLARLHENRDLLPANNLHSLFKGVLMEHWGVDRADLDRHVFPSSAPAKAFTGLVT